MEPALFGLEAIGRPMLDGTQGLQRSALPWIWRPRKGSFYRKQPPLARYSGLIRVSTVLAWD